MEALEALFTLFRAEKMETKAINRTLERKAFPQDNTSGDVIF